MDPLKLSLVGGDLAAGLARMRAELSRQLLGGATDRRCALEIVEDDGDLGAPAWTDSDGTIQLARITQVRLGVVDREAVLAVAHQLVHAIGEGPAFTRLEDQLLEEAITEVITQCYLGQFAEAFGGPASKLEPLFQFTPGGNDVQLRRMTATAASVERFGRLVAWIEGFDGLFVEPGAEELEELEASVLAWACKLKALEPEDRFRALAAAAAEVDMTEDGDDVGATAFLLEYLRGYLQQLEPGTLGFAALEYASSQAWQDEGVTPEGLQARELRGWMVELNSIERITLQPFPRRGDLLHALQASRNVGTPEVNATVERSLEVRKLLWGARMKDAQKE